ncbi:MAG TPA: GDYXXLXY domain-containing protein [Mesorhizobium sp.]|nr:GDYXXLXY domain-containing protein [Mesorhizobium sp.]
MTGKRLIVAAVLLALAQIGFLGWIIAGRAAILRDGKEVLLRVEPVDPRDLLRGDYINLGYEISSIPASLIAGVPASQTTSGDSRLTVRLKRESDGYWRPAAAWLGEAPSPPQSDDEADIAGHISAGWNLTGDTVISADYGIERFYLPEGEGMAIQNDMRVRPFGIRAALARDGTAQIKALMDGDRTLFEEPLY